MWVQYPWCPKEGVRYPGAEVTGLWAVQCGFRKRTPISLPLSHASSPIMLLDYWTLGSLSSAAEEALSHWKLMVQGQSTFSEHIFSATAIKHTSLTYKYRIFLSWLISEQTLDCNFIFSWKFYKTLYIKLSNFLTTALLWSWDYCDKCLVSLIVSIVSTYTVFFKYRHCDITVITIFCTQVRWWFESMAIRACFSVIFARSNNNQVQQCTQPWHLPVICQQHQETLRPLQSQLLHPQDDAVM